MLEEWEDILKEMHNFPEDEYIAEEYLAHNYDVLVAAAKAKGENLIEHIKIGDSLYLDYMVREYFIRDAIEDALLEII